MTPHIKHALLPGGPRLPYVEQGDPAGVPLVLLHGYSDSWRSWEPVLAHIPQAVHAYAVSQRGHGDADRPTDGYRPQDLAGDAAAFMDIVGLEAAVIVGHSAGTVTAQDLAVDRPERTLGLVLVGAAPTFRGNPGVMELWDAVSGLTDPVDPGFVRAFQESTVSRPLPAAFLDAIIAESLKLPARVWKAALHELLEAGAPTASGPIAAPTLILWGDHDELARRSDQQALAAAIPHARAVTYPGCGHAPHWEQPMQVAADLAAFAASLANPPRPAPRASRQRPADPAVPVPR